MGITLNQLNKGVNNMKTIYPNKDDFKESFWKHNYLIHVSSQGIPFKVNADCPQDAMDYIIDYCEEHLPGLLFDIGDEDREEFFDEYIRGGSHGRVLNTYNINIKDI